MPKNPTCNYENCTKRAYYKCDGIKERYCSWHKLEGMIPMQKCQNEDCKKWGIFRFLGSDKFYCTLHKLEGMYLNRVLAKGKESGKQSKDKTTIKRKCRARPISRSSSPSTCSSCSSVNQNLSESTTSRATKIGKVWKTDQGAQFFCLFPAAFSLISLMNTI